jgi:hypothetical protein
MRDIEVIYRRLFEACGTCRLQDEIKDLYNDMKRNKIDPDKVTFGTYYQAYQVAKKPLPCGSLQNNSNNPFGSSNSASDIGVPLKERYLKHTAEDF